MKRDEKFMARCIELASKGSGNVAPNPMVGCVIVYDGKIIGEGFHKKYGWPHAEVNAIKSISSANKKFLSKSTLYVNLEPCAHFGKTPPCADLIVCSRIPSVVVGSLDPNPLVSGKGIEKLRTAGVQVATEVLKKESDFLNRRFLTFQTKHRPYVILKWAQSRDGFMAPHEAKQVWLTDEKFRAQVHKWRGDVQAIMVGVHTVEIDDPELTVRLVKGKNPIRITIDRRLSLKQTKKIFRRDAPVIVFNEIENSLHANIQRIKINFKKNVLEQIMRTLYSMNILSLIVEGGPETLSYFVDSGLWDEARVFTTQHVFGDGKPAPIVSADYKRTLGLVIFKK